MAARAAAFSFPTSRHPIAIVSTPPMPSTPKVMPRLHQRCQDGPRLESRRGPAGGCRSKFSAPTDSMPIPEPRPGLGVGGPAESPAQLGDSLDQRGHLEVLPRGAGLSRVDVL